MRHPVAALLYGSVGALLASLLLDLGVSAQANDPYRSPWRIPYTCTPYRSHAFCTVKFDDGVRCMWVENEESKAVSCVFTDALPMPPGDVSVRGERVEAPGD